MKPTKDKSLGTILALTLIGVILFLVYTSKWFLIGSLVIGFLGLLSPLAARYIHVGWSRFSKVIGSVVSRILLGIIFFLVLTPLSALSRLSGKRHLRLREGGGSYFRETNKTYNRDSLKNSW